MVKSGISGHRTIWQFFEGWRLKPVFSFSVHFILNNHILPVDWAGERVLGERGPAGGAAQEPRPPGSAPQQAQRQRNKK